MKPLVLLILKETWVTVGNVITHSYLSVIRMIICIQELNQDQLIKKKLGPMRDNNGARFENIEKSGLDIKACLKQTRSEM